jgi:hypothetical protein
MARAKRTTNGYTLTWDFSYCSQTHKEHYSINSEYHLDIDAAVIVPSNYSQTLFGLFDSIVITADTLKEIIQGAIDDHENVIHKCTGRVFGIDNSNERLIDVEVRFHYEKLNLFVKQLACTVPTESADEWYENYVKYCEMSFQVPQLK